MKTLLAEEERTALVSRIGKLRPDSPRRWGKMSAAQMVCHLNDSFRHPLGEKSIASADNFFTRSILKWAALWLPVPWAHGVPTRPEVDQLRGGTPPKEFSADVQELRDLLARFCAVSGAAPAHPMFGQMSREEWLRWGYLHTDHHLRQFGV